MGKPRLISSTEIKIEKGVPLPAGWNGTASRYPFDAMGVGDSFFTAELTRAGLYAAAERWRRSHAGQKFTIRIDGEGFRVWRVA